MAKKAELLAEAKKLKLKVTEKDTIAVIEQAIAEYKAEAPVVEKKEVETTDLDETTDAEKEAKLAKAGKRSAKAIKEAEEKAAKEERKATGGEPVKARQIIKVRSKLERKGKKFQAAAKLIDNSKTYSLKNAVDLAIKTSPVKFDATVELHVKLGVDPRHADQNIRASIVLPEGTGKTVKVAVFGDDNDVASAKKAGADIAGSENFLAQLDKGLINFDILIASPTVMPKLGKYARILGPKGLMPSPKSGTVTKDVAKAVKEAKAGKIEYRVDSSGIVHIGAGKISFGTERLIKNINTVFASIKSAKPASVKGNYVQSIYITTSMGPSVKVDTSEI